MARALIMMVVLVAGFQVEAAEVCNCGESHNTTGEWTELTSDGGVLTSGNYYLAEDVTLTTDLTIETGEIVNLCLNGYVLEGTGTDSVIKVYGTLNLYDDTDSTNTHVITDPRSSDPTATILVTGGVITGGGIYVKSGTVNMYDGTIAGNTTSSGGGVYLCEDSTFTMYGGEISYNSASDGGAVYVYNSTFTMKNGSIVGNTAANGGGVYLNTSGSFIMEGGIISENVASKSGGGVHAYSNLSSSKAEFSMSGGSIKNNVASESWYGGGVYINADSTGTMTGGTITQNTTNVEINDRVTTGKGVFTNTSGTEIESSSTSFSAITIIPSDGGCVNATSLYAIDGSSVTLMVIPEDGYEFDTLTAVDSDEIEVTVTGNTFTMPAGGVTVTATFKLMDATETPGEEEADDKEDNLDDKGDTDENLEDENQDLEDEAQENEDETSVDTVPETGDVTNLWWFAVAIMSLVSLVGLGYKKVR